MPWTATPDAMLKHNAFPEGTTHVDSGPRLFEYASTFESRPVRSVGPVAQFDPVPYCILKFTVFPEVSGVNSNAQTRITVDPDKATI